MVAVKQILLFLGASFVAQAQLSTVLSDLASVKSQTASLTTALGAFSGKQSQLLAILSATSKLQKTVAAATTAANNLPAPSNADQAMILTAAQGLYPGIIASLTATVKDIPSFTKLGLGSSVTQNLMALLKGSDGLSAALSSKATGQYKTLATQLTNAIDAAFSSALNTMAPASSMLSPVPSSGGSGSGGASSSAPAMTTKATGSSPPVYMSSSMATPAPSASTPAATPVSSAPVYSPPAMSSATPIAPIYTGAANKVGAAAGGAIVLAAAAFAL